MTFHFQNLDYQISRYPKTTNRSLQVWSAADEHLLYFLENENLAATQLAIYHDRFGFLTCLLHGQTPFSIFSFKSQEKSCLLNLAANQIEFPKENFLNPLSSFPKKVNFGIIKIPKSLELFRLYLYQLSQSLEEGGTVVCSFMTRHFSKQMLTIAEDFFKEIEQSKAWKKSRLLILKKKKPFKEISILHSIPFDGKIFRQYFGVFSSNNIDYASQFFLQHLKLKEGEKRVLDLASGNGVLASFLQTKNPELEIHLMDDSFLAVESSKLNLEQNEKTFFHYNDSMDIFEDEFFDVVVSNPPFHFEYETNIEVSIALFEGVEKCLKKGGRFQLVASRHLNSKTHLIKIFPFVGIVFENEKFIIYECLKRQ